MSNTHDEVDIIAINTLILEAFEDQYNRLPQYEDRLNDLRQTLETGRITSRARNELNKNIKDLEQQIALIKSGEEKNFYIVETAELIDTYNTVLKIPVKLSFTGRKAQDNKEKQEIINRYLDIAEKYKHIFKNKKSFTSFTSRNKNKKKAVVISPIISRHNKVTVSPKGKKAVVTNYKMTCNNCNNKKDFIIEENSYICEVCFSQQEILQNTTSYKDADRVNISNKYT